MEHTDTRTWIGLGGEVFCTHHAGHYLTTAATASPTLDQHTTPLNHWIDTQTLNMPPHRRACEVCP